MRYAKWSIGSKLSRRNGFVAGSELVKRAVEEMRSNAADEVVLEAETTNHGALKLYQNLGFIRDKRLHR